MVILRKVRRAIEQCLPQGNLTKILVGLSGGADSAVLLHILSSLYRKGGVGIVAAHVHHGTRGEEANRDMEVSEILARSHGCDFHVLHVGQGNTAANEAELRKRRLFALEELGKSLSVDAIALGHHRSDQAETVLMRFLAGSDWNGLAGIWPVRDALWIRPLLEVSRQEILGEANACALPFVVDSSNFNSQYRRNFVRNELIPMLKSEMNENLEEQLLSLASSAQDLVVFLNEEVAKVKAKAQISQDRWRVDVLLELSPFLLRHTLQAFFRENVGPGASLNRAQLQVLEHFLQENTERKTYALPRGKVAIRVENYLQIRDMY